VSPGNRKGTFQKEKKKKKKAESKISKEEISNWARGMNFMGLNVTVEMDFFDDDF
jgi:hypothetical protein